MEKWFGGDGDVEAFFAVELYSFGQIGVSTDHGDTAYTVFWYTNVQRSMVNKAFSNIEDIVRMDRKRPHGDIIMVRHDQSDAVPAEDRFEFGPDTAPDGRWTRPGDLTVLTAPSSPSDIPDALALLAG